MAKKKVPIQDVQGLLNVLQRILQEVQQTASEGGDVHHLVIDQVDVARELITSFLAKHEPNPFPDPTPQISRPYLVHADRILAKEEQARNLNAANAVSSRPAPVEELTDIEVRMLIQARLYGYLQRNIRVHNDIPEDDSAVANYVELIALGFANYDAYCKWYPNSITQVLFDVVDDIIANRQAFKQTSLFT